MPPPIVVFQFFLSDALFTLRALSLTAVTVDCHLVHAARATLTNYSDTYLLISYKLRLIIHIP